MTTTKKHPMTIRRLLAPAALGAALAIAALPAQAAGGIYGTGAATSTNCPGGSLALDGVNTTGLSWVMNATVTCPTSGAQSIVIPGQWNPATGGQVVGFGNGLLVIGPVGCGGNGNVSVTVQAAGAPLVTAKASITRVCA